MANSYTTFPESVQTFDLRTDVSSSVYTTWKQFNNYIANGEFANATNLLQTNTELQKCIIDSVYINKLSKTVEEIQTLFLNEIQTYIHETIIDKGEWDATTKYVKYNFVTYAVNGVIQTFECVRDDTPIATIPTDETYWIPRVIQGEKGESGLGLTPRGLWSDTALYLVNDFVSYNNSFWQCLNQNNNSEPTNSNRNWLRLIDLSADIIKLSEEVSVDIDNAISEHNTQVNTEGGAHGFRYYQNELQYKNGSNWNTIEIGAGGSYVGTTAPTNTELLWIDTGNSGVLKYYNGTSWVATKAVWG